MHEFRKWDGSKNRFPVQPEAQFAGDADWKNGFLCYLGVHASSMKTPRLSHVLLLSLACLCCGLAAEEVYRKEISSTVLLKTQADSAGRKIEYPTQAPAEVTGVLVNIPVGKETGWHSHTVPCFAYVLEGEVTVEWIDGSRRTVKAGEAFAEVVNLRHNGSNRGSVDAKLVMFAAGVKDKPFTVKQ